MKRTYQGVQISQRQAKLVDFLQKGNNRFWEAFSQVKKKNASLKSEQFYASWFNRTLKQLQSKELFLDIPFVYQVEGGYIWANPGVKGSKSNFVAYSLHDAVMEVKSLISKPVI